MQFSSKITPKTQSHQANQTTANPPQTIHSKTPPLQTSRLDRGEVLRIKAVVPYPSKLLDQEEARLSPIFDDLMLSTAKIDLLSLNVFKPRMRKILCQK